MQVTVRVRREVRGAERSATRLDGHLVEAILRAGDETDHGVPGLVQRDEASLLVRHDDTGPNAAEQDLVARLVEVRARDRRALGVHGDDRRFVQEVRELGTGVADGERRELLQVDVGVEWTLRRMHLEDLETIGCRRHADFDDAIESAGATHGRIEHVLAVRRGHPDDPFAAGHAVHLDEQLVQRQVFFARAVRTTTLAADGVELVDEDDAASMVPSLRGEVAHAPRADADVHLTEFGAGCY